MSETPRLSLPFLSAGQAQKETTHNEALQVLDFAVAATVLEPPRNDPPASHAVGDCYIVGAAPTGTWAGWVGAIAGYTEGGWRRIPAVLGMRVYVQSTDQWATFRSSGWEFGALRGAQLVINGQPVVGPRAAAISAPSGGSTIDVEGRASIAAILLALREHGLIAS